MGVEVIQLWYNPIEGLIMNYNRTRYGKVHYMYANQRKSSRLRKMPMPTYTKKELWEWVRNQPLYDKLFSIWEESKYNRMDAPSIDRKDDKKPYSFDNIQLMSFRENNRKSHKDRVDGVLITKQNSKVSQYTKDGEFVKSYYSINQAARELDIKSSSKITEVCKGKRKSAYGFKWQYVQEV